MAVGSPKRLGGGIMSNVCVSVCKLLVIKSELS